MYNSTIDVSSLYGERITAIERHTRARKMEVRIVSQFSTTEDGEGFRYNYSPESHEMQQSQ